MGIGATSSSGGTIPRQVVLIPLLFVVRQALFFAGELFWNFWQPIVSAQVFSGPPSSSLAGWLASPKVAFGGFLALLMAAKSPGAVRSLTLIEPSALPIGRGNPDVEDLIARIAPVLAAAPEMSAEQYVLAFRRALHGLPPDAPLELTA